MTSLNLLPCSLYIHIPFCQRRCSYCDFNTYAGLEGLIADYVTALTREVRLLGAAAVRRLSSRLPVHTVFLGGGTPSLLPLPELARIFIAVREAFELAPTAEISLETNPGTVDPAWLRGARELGVNRLSLGMQSAHPAELQLLGRIHNYEEAVQAVDWARAAGFENLNLDLIYGLPGQSLERWEGTLRRAVGLGVEHLSLYALTLEEGTPLLDWVTSGQQPEPDPDLAADMYDLATDILESAGYYPYEISNWARHAGSLEDGVQNPAYACRHNLQYWRNRPYLGFGAGAAGYITMPAKPFLEGDGAVEAGVAGSPINIRITNVLGPAEYILRLAEQAEEHYDFPQTPAAAQVTPIDLPTEIGETMMMGLRLTREGVSGMAFRERFDRELVDVFGAQIERLIGLGLLEWVGKQEEVLRLTPRGRLLGNQVFVEFI